MNRSYDDIIGLPHHVSPTRRRMSRADRAAQFAPFAALTGYDDAIAETGRLTDKKFSLSEDARTALDLKLAFLSDLLDSLPQVSITYFKPDARKSGGSYLTATGRLKKIDIYERLISLEDGRTVPLDDIFEIDSELFKGIF